jgi:heterodisulfide reductase subunit D
MGNKNKYKLLKEQIRKCIQCGSCRVNCPTAEESGWLSASARSKVLYARDIIYARPWSKPKITEEFSKRVFECTMCGRCGVECITDISFPEVWIDLREMAMDSGVKIDVVEMVGKTISEKKNVADQPNEERNVWLKRAKLGFDPSEVEKADVVLFVGCMGAYYPQSQPMVRAFAQVMEAAGIKFAIMGTEEYCCGFPLLSAGKVDDAVSLMRHNMDVVKKIGAKLMVSACPACMKTWRDEYSHYLHEEMPFEVKHATEFVSELLKDGKIKLEEAKKEQTVTYHDGCDLGRNAGIYDAPREVIKMIPGLTLVDHPESREISACCGAGGDMLMTNADMAKSIGMKRATKLAEVAEVVMTACPACKKQLKDTAKHAGVNLKSQDIIELVAKQLPKPEKLEKSE